MKLSIVSAIIASVCVFSSFAKAEVTEGHVDDKSLICGDYFVQAHAVDNVLKSIIVNDVPSVQATVERRAKKGKAIAVLYGVFTKETESEYGGWAISVEVGNTTLAPAKYVFSQGKDRPEITLGKAIKCHFD